MAGSAATYRTEQVDARNIAEIQSSLPQKYRPPEATARGSSGPGGGERRCEGLLGVDRTGGHVGTSSHSCGWEPAFVSIEFGPSRLEQIDVEDVGQA